MKQNNKYSTADLRNFGYLFSIFILFFFIIILNFVFGVFVGKSFDSLFYSQFFKFGLKEKLSFPIWPIFISLLLLFISVSFPNIIKPLYISWMFLAKIIGWINNRIILIVIFYFVFFPIGFFMKLFIKDNLGLKKDENLLSYRKLSSFGDHTALQSEEFIKRIKRPF